MSVDLPIANLVISSISLATVSISSLSILPALYTKLVRRNRNYEELNQDTLYKDEDGEATEESQAAFSNSFQKRSILILSLTGLALALPPAVNGTVAHKNDGIKAVEFISLWFNVVTWALLNLISLNILLEKICTKVYNQAILQTITLIILLAGSFLSLWSIITLNGFSATQQLGLLAGHTAIIFAFITVALTTPRRPKVYHNGDPVDAMFTVPALSKYTMSWAGTLLTAAMDQGRLKDTDIPVLDFARRAQTLEKLYRKLKPDRELWKQIFVAHWRMFTVSTILTICNCFLAYAPQFIMFNLLRNLERKWAGEDIGYTPYFWAAAMGLVKIMEAVTQGWAFWVCFYGLNFPIRSQLAAVIFGKTLRKKDVKGGGKTKEEERPNGPVDERQAEDQSQPVPAAVKKPEDEDELKHMKQGTINLIAIDTERIADCAAFSNLLVEAFLGTAIGLGFIITILGWKASLAGILAILIVVPFNVFSAKKYTRAQDKLMKMRDKKLGVISEALTGIRQIKFSALEPQWEHKINGVRTEELSTLRTAFYYDVCLMACWICNPVFFSVAALSAHAYLEGTLTPSSAFTALAVFNTLEFCMSVFPEYMANVIDALVSAKRIGGYMKSAEKTDQTTVGDVIAFKEADIRWPADLEDGKEVADETFVLRNVSVEFPQQKLSLITGKTGSGKSLLLAALLGEADIVKGQAIMPAVPPYSERPDEMANPSNWIVQNSIAYVAQIPWIENATIKDNIIFGLPFDAERYRQTLIASALEKDLEMFPDGELTEIGANGINLSGGQKWRVSFARALYSRAGILVLDDVFSAVDAHVGAHIFKHGLTGTLAHGRTRILVTHHVQLCIKAAAYMVTLEDGKVIKADSVDKLIEEDQLFDLLKHDPEQVPLKEDDLEDTKVNTGSTSPLAVESRPTPAAFTEEEGRESGSVKLSVYLDYLNACGGWIPWTWIGFTFVLSEAFSLGRSYWVKLWTSAMEVDDGNMGRGALNAAQFGTYSFQKVIGNSQQGDVESRTLQFWIGIYCAFSVGSILVGVYKYWVLFRVSLEASKGLFQQMTATVLRAPSRWLDTVPRGRILNRFTKDFEKIDARVCYDFSFLLYNVLGLFGVFVATAIISPLMLLLALFMTLACLNIAKYYLHGARELKRMESTYRSPIFEHFEATLTGITTIRAFGKTQEYLNNMYARIDKYTKSSFYQWLFNRWIGVRMQSIGGIFAAVVSAAVISIPNFDPAAAGFALAFSITFSSNIIWTIRRYANTELDMNSTERIVEYCKLPTEPSPSTPAPYDWPKAGHLVVDNLVASYAPELPPTLKGISFSALPGERVALVGRTGAGKSSFSLALFRFILASSGSISIDGIDISTIRLHDLRSRISIIPQDPVLFSGTIRSNLDPFDDFTDAQLVEALRRVHLIPQEALISTSGTETPASSVTATSVATNPFLNLASPISEGGLNLSQGQRQLLCLARSCVLKPKILLLDEATSSIDLETEEAIRESLNHEFRDTTTVIIAHRLEGVMDADRVVVMGAGEVLEEGKPGELMQKVDGIFRGMVEAGRGGRKEQKEGILIDLGGDEASGSGSASGAEE